MSEENEWYLGKILLDEYKITKILGRGGMGSVYLVEQMTGEKNLYAVKTLLKNKVKDEDSKRLFFKELRNWIDLPEHTNLVSCRFYRTVESRISIFSDYIDGGSLKDWIKNNKIDSIEKKIDIAIQFARGLQIIHNCGLIHQDIKPSNVMMTQNGICKIADFGLARARLTTEVDIHPKQTDTDNLVSTSGMTLAYCSPEQAEGKKLSRKTDIWSYGVSLMEMFVGDVTWRVGAMAGLTLDVCIANHPDSAPFNLPKPLIEILRKCFEKDPKDRWSSMVEIITNLADIYQKITHHPYLRDIEVNEKNNEKRIMSYERVTGRGIQWDKPSKWLKYAYEIDEKNHKPNSIALDDTPKKKIARMLYDLEIYQDAQDIFEHQIRKGHTELQLPLVELLKNKAVLQAFSGDVNGALTTHDKVDSILRQILDFEDDDNLWEKLAQTISEKAILLYFQEKYEESIKNYSAALKIWTALIYERKREDLILNLGFSYSNFGIVEHALGNLEKAIDLFDKGIEICKRFKSDNKAITGLARMYLNKAVSLQHMNELVNAIDLYNQARSIWEKLVKKDTKRIYEAELALCSMNAAISYRLLEKYDKAMDLYDKSITIFENHFFDNGLWDNANHLASCYMNKANIYFYTMKILNAINLHDRAINILKQLIYCEGQQQEFSRLVSSYINKANALNMLEKYREALDLYNLAIEIMERLIQKQDSPRKQSQLAWLNRNKAMTLFVLGEKRQAIETNELALNALEELILKRKLKVHTTAYWDCRIQKEQFRVDETNKESVRKNLFLIIEELKSDKINLPKPQIKNLLEKTKIALNKI